MIHYIEDDEDEITSLPDEMIDENEIIHLPSEINDGKEHKIESFPVSYLNINQDIHIEIFTGGIKIVLINPNKYLINPTPDYKVDLGERFYIVTNNSKLCSINHEKWVSL